MATFRRAPHQSQEAPSHMNLTKLREKRAAGEHGFTLIELLVVVVIIGILIAIAIPVYLNYKKGASDKSAQSDLRNAINVLEQCNTDGTSYPSALASGGGVPTGCPNQSVKASSGTSFNYVPTATTFANYVLQASNSNGNPTNTIYCYSSASGGSITKSATAITSTSTACPAAT